CLYGEVVTVAATAGAVTRAVRSQPRTETARIVTTESRVFIVCLILGYTPRPHGVVAESVVPGGHRRPAGAAGALRQARAPRARAAGRPGHRQRREHRRRQRHHPERV